MFQTREILKLQGFKNFKRLGYRGRMVVDTKRSNADYCRGVSARTHQSGLVHSAGSTGIISSS